MTQENRDGGQKERKTSQRPSCHKNEGEGDERISQKAGYAIFASVLKTVYAIFFRSWLREKFEKSCLKILRLCVEMNEEGFLSKMIITEEVAS